MGSDPRGLVINYHTWHQDRLIHFKPLKLTTSAFIRHELYTDRKPPSVLNQDYLPKTTALKQNAQTPKYN